MKKWLLGIAWLGWVWAEPDSLIPPDPQVVNAFAQSNPGYRKRAADSYEQGYFPTALEQLERATGLSKPDLRRVLQGFVYRWLDRYVERSGRMTAGDLEEMVGWLDGQIKQRLGSKPMGAYDRWKRSADNTLGFLFRVHTSN